MKLERTLTLMVVVAIGGCANLRHDHVKPDVKPPVNPGNDLMDAELWMQTAAEYRGNSLVVYQAATKSLRYVIGAKDRTAAIEQADIEKCTAGNPCDSATLQTLPAAVVLDVDETILDNSAYDARLIRDNSPFRLDTWDQWVAARQARAIPGAVAFIEAARNVGAAIIYISNRSCAARKDDPGKDPCPQRRDTLENMKSVGFPALRGNDLMLLENQRPEWSSSDKRARREYVAGSYRIAMLIGDDLGDLAPNVRKESINERYEVVEQYQKLYGTFWFQLANPTYGSWTNPFNGKNKDAFLRYD